MKLHFALCAVLLSVAAACNGGTVTTDTGPGDGGGNDVVVGDVGADSGGITAMQACMDRATALCSKEDMCSNMTAVARSFPDMATCVSRELAQCTATHMAPGTAATPATIEACAMALTAQSCSDWRAGVTAAGCLPQHGTLADNSPCVADAQCMSGVCLIPGGQECGQCGPQPMDGAPCTGGTTCGIDLVCHRNSSGSGYTCRTPAMLNASCDPDHPCQGGLACVMAASDAGSGMCMALGNTVGTACNYQNVGMPSCDGFFGLYCNNMNQCATATAATSGQPCGVMNSGAADAFCQGGSSCYMHTCTGPVMDNGACNTEMGLDCLSPARCVVNATDAGGYDGGLMGTCLTFNPTACM